VRLYRYTVAIEGDVLDEMEYTIDYRDGEFWKFYNAATDKTLRVKVQDIRYIEATYLSDVDAPAQPVDAP
jgi:hypothetical protein